MDIALHVVRYFCVLADELHFARAAATLGIAGPTLSQQIGRLEQTLGVKLFERTPRKVDLTAAGAELLPLARRLRDDHDEIVRWAKSRGATDAPPLRIGLVAAGAGALTTAILSRAIQLMPGVRLEMRRLGFFDTTRELLEDAVDVVFAPSPIELDDRVRAHPLWREPRVLVIPTSHRLAGRTEVSITEIGDEVFVMASGGVPRILDWWAVDPRPDGSRPRYGPVADDFEGILELVAAGVGVNIAGASAAQQYRRDGLAFVRVSDIEPSTILLCALERPTNPVVKTFVELALETAPVWPLTAEASPTER